MRLMHIITGLNTGGAEMMLYKLLSAIDREVFEAEVVSLMDIGPVGQKIRALGVPVRALGMSRGRPSLLALYGLARHIRQRSPRVIQTWMYHADLAGGIAARLAGRYPVVWGIRRSNLEPGVNRPGTIWTARACARISRRVPERIVCCSEASRREHTGMGYDPGRMVVIPNGFDNTNFHPDPGARLSVRRELGIPGEALLIGLVGRFYPQKDHGNFIRAAALLNADFPEVHFLLCGDGVTRDNKELAHRVEDAGIAGRCHLLGRREDMPRLTAALDIASSSSYSEGFPNVIGEAMACGVPCAVTDAGDSALIVGDTGLVVPPRRPEALAGAWRRLIGLGPEGREQLGLAARRRVGDYFSLPAVVKRYENLYLEVAR